MTQTLKWKCTWPWRQISLLRKGRFPHNCFNIKVAYCILMYPKYLLAYFAFLPWRTLLLRWPVVSTRRLAVAPRWVWCKDQWWASVAVPVLLLSLSVLLYYMLIRICDGPSAQVPGLTEKNMTGRKQELVAFRRRQMSFEIPGRADQILEFRNNQFLMAVLVSFVWWSPLYLRADVCSLFPLHQTHTYCLNTIATAPKIFVSFKNIQRPWRYRAPLICCSLLRSSPPPLPLPLPPPLKEDFH